MDDTFSNILRGKVVTVGMGNALKGDDGAGCALVRKIRGKTNALCIDAGSAPENYLGKIIKEKPDTVLFVDAADIGKSPGNCAFLKKEEILKTGFTTHDMNAGMLIEYLEKETKADIYLLGIQPRSVAFGEGLSEEVKKAIDEISKGVTKCTKHT